MKKLIMIVAATLMLAGCDKPTQQGSMITTEGETLVHKVRLYTIEFRGEKHEYVYWADGYAGSLSHWEGCRYCKEHSNSESEK